MTKIHKVILAIEQMNIHTPKKVTRRSETGNTLLIKPGRGLNPGAIDMWPIVLPVRLWMHPN